jgi:hypothetical protein
VSEAACVLGVAAALVHLRSLCCDAEHDIARTRGDTPMQGVAKSGLYATIHTSVCLLLWWLGLMVSCLLPLQAAQAAVRAAPALLRLVVCFCEQDYLLAPGSGMAPLHALLVVWCCHRAVHDAAGWLMAHIGNCCEMTSRRHCMARLLHPVCCMLA